MYKQLPRFLHWSLVIVLCLLGAVASVNIFGRAEFEGDGFSFAARIKLLAPGETQLRLPPIGVAAARTHQAPVQIGLELRGLKSSLLGKLSTDPAARDTVLSETKEQARRATMATALMAIVLGGLGSLVVILLFRLYKPAILLAAFMLGSLFCGGLLAWTYFDYDMKALQQPRYEGILDSAPWVMSILTNSLDGLERLGQSFEVMARNLPHLTRGVRAGAPMSSVGEDLKVLHVSDIHNNTAAFDLIGSLVESFAVDAVIDTGDLTDYGTPFESGITKAVGNLRVPYVFAPGNHESPDVVARLRRNRNVVVLDGRIVTIRGLKILGIPDPSSYETSPGVSPPDSMAAFAERLADTWEKAAAKPDLVAAHHRELLEPLIGRAGVVLHGHDHRASLMQSEGTVIEDAGTSGAAGLRGLASDSDVPYTVYLQYWRREPTGGFKLLAVDGITVDGLNGKLQVVRTTMDSLRPGAASAKQDG